MPHRLVDLSHPLANRCVKCGSFVKQCCTKVINKDVPVIEWYLPSSESLAENFSIIMPDVSYDRITVKFQAGSRFEYTCSFDCPDKYTDKCKCKKEFNMFVNGEIRQMLEGVPCHVVRKGSLTQCNRNGKPLPPPLPPPVVDKIYRRDDPPCFGIAVQEGDDVVFRRICDDEGCAEQTGGLYIPMCKHHQAIKDAEKKAVGEAEYAAHKQAYEARAVREAAEKAVAEAERRLAVARDRAARLEVRETEAATAISSAHPTKQPTTKKGKKGKAAKTAKSANTLDSLVHLEHVRPKSKADRTACFDAKQEVARAEAEARRTKAAVEALKRERIAMQCVPCAPPPPTLADVVEAALLSP